MAHEIRFDTPEDIELHLTPAGAGSRALAYMIDEGIILILTLVLGVSAYLAVGVGSELEDVAWLAAAAVLVLNGVMGTLYYILCEMTMDGQSVGKRNLAIRVVDHQGYTLGMRASVVRNLFRVVEQIPVFWLIPLFNRAHRRLGDYVAGTVVVQAGRGEAVRGFWDQMRWVELPQPTLGLSAADYQVFGPRELGALETYLRRRDDLPAPARVAAGEAILTGILGVGGVTRPVGVATDVLVQELYLGIRDHGRRRDR